jgi:Ca2+-binding RTX toxin-like protein
VSTADLQPTTINESPTGTADALGASHGTALEITAQTLLANDTDPDSPSSGWSIYSVSSGTGGAVVLNPNGNLTFTAAPGFLGQASFTYQLSDGQGGVSDPTTVTVDVSPAVTINGTEARDTISPTKTVAGQPLPTAYTDLIFGHAGNDSLNGGAGADHMYGGAGSDSYTVDSTFDVVSEANRTTGLNDGGTDSVVSSVDFMLYNFVENLTLTGSAVRGTGNALVNVITGSAGNNILLGEGGNDALDGGAGNDRLIGGTGADQLTGGVGADIFVFNVTPVSSSADQIRDFTSGLDRLEFDDAVFTSLQANSSGRLLSGQFRLGTAAADANDFLIYDQRSARLFYDADGSGAGSAIYVTALAKGGTPLSLDDLFVA